MIDSLYRPAIAPPRRRSPESPTLWMLLLAGSILLHIALFLILRPFWIERSGGQGGDGQIAIDFVDSNPGNSAGSAGTGQGSLSPSASAKTGAIAPVVTAPPLPETDADIQAPPRSSQSTPAPAAAPLSLGVPPAMPPSRSPQPTPAAAGPSTLSPQGGQSAAPRSPGAIAPVPQPVVTPAPSVKPVQPIPQPLPAQPNPSQPNPSQPISSTNRLPAPVSLSNSNNQSIQPIQPIAQPVQTAPTTVQPEGAKGLRMKIVGDPRPLHVQNDPPDQPLQLVSSRDLSFPGVPLPPCIRRSSGNLSLVLQIDRETGKPKPEQLDTGSVCDPSIAKLVRENIRFSPALLVGGGVQGQVQIELKLTAL